MGFAERQVAAQPWLFRADGQASRHGHGRAHLAADVAALGRLLRGGSDRVGHDQNGEEAPVAVCLLRRGNTLKRCKDFYLKAKARIWPVCAIAHLAADVAALGRLLRGGGHRVGHDEDGLNPKLLNPGPWSLNPGP